MTTRETAAIVFISVGVVLLVVAAATMGGWPAALAVIGGVLVILGILLGIDPTVPADDGYRLVDLEDYDDAGQRVQ